MRKSRRLVPAVLVAATAAVAGGSVGAAADSGYPRVSANTNVAQNDKSPVRDLAIANIAVDPSNPNRVAVAGGDWRAGNCFLYVSTDGGATFAVGKQSPIPPQFDTCAANGGTNPWGIAFDKSGNILVGLMAANRPSTTGASGSVILSKTTDNGNTWSSTIVKDNRGANPPQGAGTVYVAVDASNRIYVSWQQRGVPVTGYSGTQRRAEIAVSTDDGSSFSAPVDLEGDPSSTLSIGGPWISVVGNTLYAVYAQSPAATGSSAVFTAQQPGVQLVKSTDGGRTFTSVSTVLTKAETPAFFGNPDFAATTYQGGTAMALVFEAIAQGTAGSQYQLRDIYSVNSTDGGSTWSTPKRVTDDDIGTDLGNKYVPGIAASPNGRFDAAWIDFRNDNGNLLSDTYYASSTDGGSTWSKNIKVSDRPSNRHYGQFANYSDIRSNVNVFSNNYAAYMVWDDTRNASPSADAQDIYFASVQQAAIPASTGTTILYIIIAVAGGLVLAAVILVVLGVVLRTRRSSAPKPPVGTAAS